MKKDLKNYLVESPAEKEEVNNYGVYCRTIITVIDKILAEIDHRFSNNSKSIILGVRALVPGSPNFLEEEDIFAFTQLYGANIDDLLIELKNMEKVMKRKNSNKPASLLEFQKYVSSVAEAFFELNCLLIIACTILISVLCILSKTT
ncbi:uncharacterized protein LOC129963809 [Argiope bruennichi]|uniref:uncharacterized protein LOC129963809 n=1 Tax=Argiope bruennichi TaxID=94029 RepID=UPI0024953FB0|nr:uncharacterized protein LOC129963809 [Argiope bruennichi]